MLSLGLVRSSLCRVVVGDHLALEKRADCHTYCIYVFICVLFLVNDLGAISRSFVPLHLMVTLL